MTVDDMKNKNIATSDGITMWNHIEWEPGERTDLPDPTVDEIRPAINDLFRRAINNNDEKAGDILHEIFVQDLQAWQNEQRRKRAMQYPFKKLNFR